MSSNLNLTKQDICNYLLALSKEYKKLSNRTPIQLLIVGGASIILNYGFRLNTIDIDAYYGLSDAMKQAISNVSDNKNLPLTFLNDDFKFTNSFSHKLYQYSTYFKTFSNVMEVRTIKSEYLIAMKLVAARKIKHDRSDIIGIIIQENKAGYSITLDSIKQAVINLYGSWDYIEKEAQEFIEKVMKTPNLEEIFDSQDAHEKSLRSDVKNIFEKTTLKQTKDNLNKLIEQLDKTK